MNLGREARRRPVHLVLAALVCALAALAAIPALAAADTYTVNLKSVGSGCTPGACTLPGAIEAANGHSGKDVIEFEEGTFGGAAPQSTIPLSTSLPTVTEEVEILGGICPTGYLIPGPCVELTLSATASTPILNVTASNVTVEGLAFEGAGYGIQVEGGQNFKAVGDWFGSGLNLGTGTGSATAGIRIGPGSNSATIGGTSASERNVFQQGKIGAYVDGASSAVIAGNWFGLRPDGQFQLGHSIVEGVRIVDKSSLPTSSATDNQVGGTLGAPEAQGSACDGPCNVFATEQGGIGVNLAGSSGESNSAATGPTRIAGNYFGLDPNGTAAIGRGDYGVLATPAGTGGVGPGEVTIGGMEPATEGNYFDKAAARGIEGRSASHLAIVGNELGYAFGQTAGEAANIAVTSSGPEGAYIESNSIEAGNGIGIESHGTGSVISENTIAGGLIGIFTAEPDGGVGNLIEDNRLNGPVLFGVLLENSQNGLVGNAVTGSEVGLKVEGEDFEHQAESNLFVGNTVTGAGHVGIEVGSDANHTRVGGDGPGEANTIDGVGHLHEEEGDGAITILSRQTGRTEVAANTGSGNALKFITLLSHGGAEEPNGGIKPPTIATALQSSGTGSGARPNATIRVFGKASSEAGELGKLLAVVSADSAGNWTATYAIQPVGTLVVATQTQEGATSELSAPRAAAADPVAPTPSGNTGGGSTTPAPPTTTPAPIAAPAPKAPKVKITKGPKKSSAATKATFKFKGEPAAGAKFECKLDGGKWATCSSPRTYKGLKPGKPHLPGAGEGERPHRSRRRSTSSRSRAERRAAAAPSYTGRDAAGSPDPVLVCAMSLRPLLELAAENERVHALAGDVLAAADGGEGITLRASETLRPLLLAALLEDDRGLAGRPALLVAADDRAARDLAADLRAYLAPRRVRLYPSRGTGYASSVTPPPHLVGLRIDALDALTREADAVVVASAVALAEAVPDASLRPAGFEIAKGDEIDLGAVAEDLIAAGYERAEQVEERGQFAVRGGILDVYPATEERAVRIELFGDEVESMRWFSTFTQRSLGDAETVELAPAAELDADHRELAAIAAQEAAEGEGEKPTWRSSCRWTSSARPSTSCPTTPLSSSPPRRRSSPPCATSGRTRRPR